MSGMDWIVAGVITLIIFLAVSKILKDRKSGVKCTGCSCAGSCDQRATSGNCAE
ncbi:MAG: FeoB-associated Cys-rich membrane protein [Peptococcaceae bacterium]|nr:FeoB-associated Cys-rich membrane protein [Peptococcaceae bacterium]